MICIMYKKQGYTYGKIVKGINQKYGELVALCVWGNSAYFWQSYRAFLQISKL